MANTPVLQLTPTERGELRAYLRKRNLPASVAQRMRIVLLLDEGITYREIEEKLGVPASGISRWKQRYQNDRTLGLATIHPGQPPQKLTPQLRARVLERTRQVPLDGSTHWSLRKMAAVMKVSKNLIARIWKEADLKPHRLDRYMASNDPQFEQKAAAIIGLYLNPQTGEVFGQTAARHTSQEFVTFLEEVVATQPAQREVHVILDNFATHKTELVQHFLEQHPNVSLHFTPTYSSWLNQVEAWFSKLQRDVIDRGIFTSVADLKRKILRYIRLYQKTAKPFQWKYSDVRKRIPAW
jgi:transposase